MIVLSVAAKAALLRWCRSPSATCWERQDKHVYRAALRGTEGMMADEGGVVLPCRALCALRGGPQEALGNISPGIHLVDDLLERLHAHLPSIAFAP